MVLAHLAGLLQPTYAHGVRSIAAENLMLDAMEIRELVDHQRLEQQMQLGFSGFFQANKVQEMFRHFSTHMGKLGRINMLDLSTVVMQKAKGSIDEMTNLFYALSKAGVISNPELPAGSARKLDTPEVL
jgi:hypothetical protein